MKKIIFYAASDKNVPENRIGGAEVGSRRTYNILVERGFDVEYIPKVNKLYGVIKFIKDLITTTRKLKKLFSSTKENGIFYITAFYKNQAPIEYFFIKKAKKNKLKIVYEPKNGSFIKRFNEGNSRYKKTIRKTLALCDCVFCQGQEYVDFIKPITSGECVYIPNYVHEIDEHISKKSDAINIAYFGRISESKNVRLILEVCNILKLDCKVKCKIIGSCDSEYGQELIRTTKEFGLEDNVKFLGRLPLKEIRKECWDSDYFIFPSNEEEEGHSNSLTEAMSFGLVPVVSPNGFSRSIVGDDKYVVDEYDPKKYADKIIELSKDLENNKEFAKNRILNNFTAKIVIERQIKYLENL